MGRSLPLGDCKTHRCTAGKINWYIHSRCGGARVLPKVILTRARNPPTHHCCCAFCPQDRFRSNMARAPNAERVTAVKGDSLLSLSGLVAAGATSTFDAIYVDGDHTVRYVCYRMCARLSCVVCVFGDFSLGGINANGWAYSTPYLSNADRWGNLSWAG